jgi:hypothetical protein
MFERFTDRARRVLVLAQEEARQLNHGFIGTEHILLGLMDEGEGVAARALDQVGVSLDEARRQVEEMVGAAGAAPPGSPPFTARAKRVMELALREALQLGHNYIGTEHLLLGLIREGDGVASRVLTGLGVDLGHLRSEVLHLLSGFQSAALPGQKPLLRRYGELVACSFCGRRPPESGRLVSGRGRAYICELCLRDLGGRLQGDESEGSDPAEDPVEPVIVSGRLPDDPPAATAQILAAFNDALVLSDDRRTVPNVEGGASLGPCLKEAQERHADLRRKDHTVTIDDVEFVDEEHAIVMFAVSLAGRPRTTLRGAALLIDDAWKMARGTFCELMGLAGVECPPD